MLCCLFLHTSVYHFADIGIALVCNDAFGIVIHFLFTVLNMLFQVLRQRSVQLQPGAYLLVALEHLNGIPAQVLCVYHSGNRLFNMGNGVLYAACKHMRVFAHAFRPCRLDGLFRHGHAALALQSAHFHHGAAKFGAQLRKVYSISVLAHKVNHIHRHHNRQAQLDKLRGEVKVSLDIGAVHNVDDGIRLLVHQIAAGHHFFQRVRAERVDAGQVLNDNVLMAFQPALFLFHGDARPVANILAGARQVVEQCRLAAVGVACKRNGNAHVFTPPNSFGSFPGFALQGQ